jgi:hypothetical protein
MDTSHSKDGTDTPNFKANGIYGKDYDNENEEFSYHLLDGLAEERINDHGELGADAVGTSPLVTPAGGKTRKVDDLPNWLQEITCNQTYDKTNLLAALVTKTFLVLLAVTTRMSTTPQHGFQPSCGSQAHPHGKYLILILVRLASTWNGMVMMV